MKLPDKEVMQTLQSKVVSMDEFNFDTLFARPLYSMLNQYDIDQLYKIATSVRFAGNPRKRYKAIDDIMHSRGFKKLSAGTNRVAYTYFEDPTIVVKVAADKTAMNDNIREFVNQSKLKPFCTKCFECDPTGTVGVFERVHPITSREEYMTVASEVFEMLDTITGQYVLADIGSAYFMNVGIRKLGGFGPVLLDYPYLYETDGSKLVCTKPDPNSPTGVCGGLIDYDAGFNKLYCKKCGKVFRAIELGKYLETSQIIRKGTGKMSELIKVKVKVGGKVINSTETEVMKKEVSVMGHQEAPKKEENKSKILTVKVKRDGHGTAIHQIDTTQSGPDIPQYNYKAFKKNKHNKNNKSYNQNQKPQQSNTTNNPKVIGNVYKNDKPKAKVETPIPEKENDTKTKELENRVNELLKENERLSKENSAINLQISNLVSKGNESGDKTAKLEAQVKDLLKKNENLYMDNITKNSQISELKSDNRKQKAKIEELKKVADQDNVEYDKLQEQLEAATNQNSEELEQAKADIIKLEDENNKLKEQLKAESEKPADTSDKDTIVELNKTIEDLKQQINELQQPAEEESYEEDSDEEYDEEEEDNPGDGFTYIDGKIYSMEDFAKLVDREMPTEAADGSPIKPSLRVIVFEDDNGGYFTDQYGNIIVVKSITKSDKNGNNKQEAEIG